jgi:hypothetical protein
MLLWHRLKVQPGCAVVCSILDDDSCPSILFGKLVLMRPENLFLPRSSAFELVNTYAAACCRNGMLPGHLPISASRTSALRRRRQARILKVDKILCTVNLTR